MEKIQLRMNEYLSSKLSKLNLKLSAFIVEETELYLKNLIKN